MGSDAPLISIALWAITALVLVSAGFVVFLRNLFRAALSLGLTLIGIAGLFILLEADFLAFVQILVYVGAILTLVVFAIMLTAKLEMIEAFVGARQRALAGVACAALFAALVVVINAMSPTLRPADTAIPLAALGREMVTTLVLPFEVISLVFVAAMVGAIAVAASRSGRSDRKASS